MALTRKQFDILAALADSEKALTQRELKKRRDIHLAP